MYSGVQQNQLGVQKVHGNKLHLIEAPWFSKFFEGKLHIPLGRRGGGTPPIPQGCRYYSRDGIVLRLLFNFLLLLFFNLKTLNWCKRINKTTTFTSSNYKIFKIFHSVNFQSSWVIYIIECNICNLQYIGKSKTAFNLCLNNHKNHIKKGVSSCELTEHFLHNKQTHKFDNNMIITIIEQIRKGNMWPLTWKRS